MSHASTVGAWVELRCTLPVVWADPVAEWLLAEKTSGVLIEEPEGGPLEPTDRVCLITAFPGESDVEAVVGKLRALGLELAARSGLEERLTVETRLISPKELESFLAPSFRPVELVGGLWVLPAGDEEAALEVPEGAKVIELTPALAFGTGQHPSTRLAARLTEGWFARSSRPPSPGVMDLGTGSGLLAIAAVLWGAAWVLAVEKEPLAVENALRNVRGNGLEGRVSLVAADFRTLKTGPRADLLIANLDRDHFLTGSEGLARWLAPGGAMVASGFLQEYEGLVRDALQAVGLSVIERAAEDTWAAFTLERR